MAWHFDEVNDDVQVTDDAVLSLPNGDWTVGGWIKLTDNAGNAFQYFFSHDKNGTTPSMNMFFGEASSSDPNKLFVRINTPFITTATTPGTSTVWQHLVIQRFGTTVSVYIDGTVDTNTITINVAVNPAGNLFLGSREDRQSARFFGGDMAEWFKVDRAISTGEITGLANGASPGHLGGVNMWYLSMAAGSYAEHRKGGLTVTNNGSTSADHAPVGPMFGFDVGYAPVAAAVAAFSTPMLGASMTGILGG